MAYGQDLLAQIGQQAQAEHAARRQGSESIDIHRETTGESITKLESQNQRLGDAIDDIQTNTAGDTRTGGNRTVTRNTNTTSRTDTRNTNDGRTGGAEQGVSTSLLSADDDVSVLFDDVKFREKDYGHTGNKIYDFLDALGNSNEDFDLLDLYSNKNTFDTAYDTHGQGNLSHDDFLDFDYSKFGDDLGFEIDFDKQQGQLTLFFNQADTGYHFADEDGGSDHSNTNSAASSVDSGSESGSAGRSNKSGGKKTRTERRPRLKYKGNARGKKKINKLFKNMDPELKEDISNFGKKVFGFIKNMFQDGENMKFGKLFSDKDKFDDKWSEYGDGSHMSHQEFKDYAVNDIQELDESLGVEIRFKEGDDDNKPELHLNFAEEQVEEADDDHEEWEYEEVEVEIEDDDDDDNRVQNNGRVERDEDDGDDD
ncbi:MAG: hypothetical protein HRT47_05775 [Candidatus Caenarcaniphilales bacterium]|nr:hypothetical protein [Candidatus Caenarcaniphilales bacterium]